MGQQQHTGAINELIRAILEEKLKIDLVELDRPVFEDGCILADLGAGLRFFGVRDVPFDGQQLRGETFAGDVETILEAAPGFAGTRVMDSWDIEKLADKWNNASRSLGEAFARVIAYVERAGEVWGFVYSRYQHGRTRHYLGTESLCRFDSGIAGIAFVPKSEAGTRKEAAQLLEHRLEQWDMWINGDTETAWSFRVERRGEVEQDEWEGDGFTIGSAEAAMAAAIRVAGHEDVEPALAFQILDAHQATETHQAWA